MKPRRKQDPVEAFVDAAVAWAKAIAENDPNAKRANRIFDRDLVPALRAVIAAGPEQVQRVVELADNLQPAVAHIAAFFALRYDPRRAERALERLARHPSLHIGLTSEWGLREWRRGTLEPQPWEAAAEPKARAGARRVKAAPRRRRPGR